jgi:NADP-dependent 3-hydroxy acid dehydrogenase YdfG
MMTKAFANNGATKVYIVGRRQEKLEGAAREASSHGNIIPIVGDVTSKESLAAISERIKRETGYINLLCCNSGTYPKPVPVKSSDVSVQDFAAKCLEQNPEDWNSTSNCPLCSASEHIGASFSLYRPLLSLDWIG